MEINELKKLRKIIDDEIKLIGVPVNIVSENSIEKSDTKLYFGNYAEYTKALRAWLVAYGIGGPVLFFTNKDASEKLSQSNDFNCVIILFVIGVVVQVILAFINKWASWHLYKGSIDPDHKETCIYRIWSKVNNQSWIDLILDMTSLVVFYIASMMVFNVLLPN